jgi:hypothetical protein
MSSFSKSTLKRASALGFGLMAAFGAMAVAAVAAPQASAQQNVNREFGLPFQEARAAITARNWPLAQQKVDAAAPHARSTQEKYYLDLARYQIAAGQNNTARTISAAEALIANPGTPAAQKSQLRSSLPPLYERAGQKDRAIAIMKELVGEGGTAQQNLWLATTYNTARNYPEAIRYGERAMRLAGARPAETYFKILMQAYFNSNNKPKYYEIVEKAVLLYPKDEYWRPLINRIETEPNYRTDHRLDLFRLRQAAGINLNTTERGELASQAMYRGFAAEAAAALTPLPSGADAALRQRAATATTQAATQAASLPVAEREATGATGRGPMIAAVAERYLASGNNAKAVTLYQAALAKGIPDAGDADLARLRLGIAQFRAGQKDAARTTWGTIRTNNVAVAMAKIWVLVSRVR